ncbi:MAG: tetratricopeptide repeat protein [Bryobacterales bacterium]|nr:tetratricopeptide repeat protein [Bryobacterales bacterium]
MRAGDSRAGQRVAPRLLVDLSEGVAIRRRCGVVPWGTAERCGRYPANILTAVGYPEPSVFDWGMAAKMTRLDITVAHAILAVLGPIPALAEADPLEYIKQSTVLLDQGYLGQAEAAASQALEHPETAPTALALLGSIRLQQERYDEGTVLLERAIRADPTAVTPRLTLAQAYSLIGRHDRSAALYREGLELAPDSQAARLGLVRAEADLGNFDEAATQAGEIQELLRSSPEGLMLLARVYAGRGDESAARGIADDWASLGRIPADWGLRIAATLLRGGLSAEAARILEHQKRQGLASFQVAFQLGEIYSSHGDTEKAAQNYELAVQFDERSVPVLRQLASIAENAGDLDRALSFARRASVHGRDDANLLLSIGRLSLLLDQVADAARALERASELRPDHARTRYLLALARAGAGERDAALATLRGLLEERGGDADVHLAIGVVLHLGASFEEASGHLEESRSREPGGLLAHYYLGMAAQGQGRHADAAALFEEILEDHPDHAASHVALGVSLAKQGRHKQALLSFETAVRLAPRSAQANLHLAQQLKRIGRWRQARKRLRAAESLPEDVGDWEAIKVLVGIADHGPISPTEESHAH